DGPNLITPTLRNAPTQPLPQEQAPAAPEQRAPGAGDTKELKTGTGDMGVAEDVNLDGVHLPGEPAPEGKPEGAKTEDKEFEAGTVLSRYGTGLKNQTLRTASKVANAPQVIIHAVQGAEMLLHDPSKALKAVQHVLDDPLKNGLEAK